MSAEKISAAKKDLTAARAASKAAREKLKSASVKTGNAETDLLLESQVKYLQLEVAVSRLTEKASVLRLKSAEAEDKLSDEDTKLLADILAELRLAKLAKTDAEDSNSDSNVTLDEIAEVIEKKDELARKKEAATKALETASTDEQKELLHGILKAIKESEDSNEKAIGKLNDRKSGGVKGVASQLGHNIKEKMRDVVDTHMPVVGAAYDFVKEHKEANLEARTEGKATTSMASRVGQAIDPHIGGIISAAKGSGKIDMSKINTKIGDNLLGDTTDGTKKLEAPLDKIEKNTSDTTSVTKKLEAPLGKIEKNTADILKALEKQKDPVKEKTEKVKEKTLQRVEKKKLSPNEIKQKANALRQPQIRSLPPEIHNPVRATTTKSPRVQQSRPAKPTPSRSPRIPNRNSGGRPVGKSAVKSERKVAARKELLKRMSSSTSRPASSPAMSKIPTAVPKFPDIPGIPKVLGELIPGGPKIPGLLSGPGSGLMAAGGAAVAGIMGVGQALFGGDNGIVHGGNGSNYISNGVAKLTGGLIGTDHSGDAPTSTADTAKMAERQAARDKRNMDNAAETAKVNSQAQSATDAVANPQRKLEEKKPAPAAPASEVKTSQKKTAVKTISPAASDTTQQDKILNNIPTAESATPNSVPEIPSSSNVTPKVNNNVDALGILSSPRKQIGPVAPDPIVIPPADVTINPTPIIAPTNPRDFSSLSRNAFQMVNTARL